MAISKLDYADYASWYDLACHIPLAPASATPHGPPTMPFTPGAPHTAIQPVVPALQDGNQSIGFPFHQVQEQTPAHPAPTPVATTEVDITKLEERLGEAMNKKLESITETTRSLAQWCKPVLCCQLCSCFSTTSPYWRSSTCRHSYGIK